MGLTLGSKVMSWAADNPVGRSIFNSPFWMRRATVGSRDAYLAHRASVANADRRHQAMLDGLAARREKFTVRGYSYPAQQFVDFRVDRLYAAPGQINWRERVVCPVTGLNNRMRVAFHLLEDVLSPAQWRTCYITEQVTHLFQVLNARHPEMIGSEFVSADTPPGTVSAAGIRHEDMTQLSFADESLGAVLSFDCLEHIPDYLAAFREAYRVLERNGVFFWSAPFLVDKYENTIRARLVGGEIEHLMEPQYHGDPMSEQGILCFQEFGWECLDQLRDIGFSDVSCILVQSRHFGYLGPEQLFVLARK
jgi:SAM-dependent methyltransferase